MSPRADTRKFHRVPVTLEVQYRTQGSFLVSYSLNLSKGGLFLETSDLLPVGTQLTIRFTIPGADNPIETRARVMWVRRKTSDEGLPPGLGLQFDNLEGQVGQFIDDMVQRFAGVTLLALADDAPALDRITRYLQSILTCDVKQASSAQVLATGFSRQIDLALVDLDSVGERGLMVVQQAVSAEPPSIPVVALTGKAVLKAMALKEGAAAVLPNPPSYEQLRASVLDVLGKPHRLG